MGLSCAPWRRVSGGRWRGATGAGGAGPRSGRAGPARPRRGGRGRGGGRARPRPLRGQAPGRAEDALPGGVEAPGLVERALRRARSGFLCRAAGRSRGRDGDRGIAGSRGSTGPRRCGLRTGAMLAGRRRACGMAALVERGVGPAASASVEAAAGRLAGRGRDGADAAGRGPKAAAERRRSGLPPRRTSIPAVVPVGMPGARDRRRRTAADPRREGCVARLDPGVERPPPSRERAPRRLGRGQGRPDRAGPQRCEGSGRGHGAGDGDEALAQRPGARRPLMASSDPRLRPGPRRGVARDLEGADRLDRAVAGPGRSVGDPWARPASTARAAASSSRASLLPLGRRRRRLGGPTSRTRASPPARRPARSGPRGARALDAQGVHRSVGLGPVHRSPAAASGRGDGGGARARVPARRTPRRRGRPRAGLRR